MELKLQRRTEEKVQSFSKVLTIRNKYKCINDIFNETLKDLISDKCIFSG